MASEVIAVLLGRRTLSRLHLIEVEAGTARVVHLAADSACPACGPQPTILSLEKSHYQPTTCLATPTAMPEHPLEVSIEEAARLLASAQPPLLVDVREPSEHATCCISAAKLIPMALVPERLAEIPQDLPVLIHCHHGGRSLRVTQFLRAKGYTKVSNVQGGIDAWAVKIDPKVRRY
jgi:adenylyltransferase/sulfurtransferase